MGESVAPLKVEKKKRKLSVGLIIGLVGIVGAWAAGQIVPLTTFDVPREEKIRLAEDSATTFRNSLVESGIYEQSRETIPDDIIDSVRRVIFSVPGINIKTGLPEHYPSTATSTIVDHFTDVDGKDHKILLLNAHGIPHSYGDTVNIKTEDGLFIGQATCLPYDYVDKNLHEVDPSSPIRDLALCDLKIMSQPTESKVKLLPLSLDRFYSTNNFSSEKKYTAYGFPIDIDSTEFDFLYSNNDFLVSSLSYFTDDASGYPRFKGDPYGPGGSGGLLIENSQVVGLMTGYSVPDSTSVIDTIFSINAGNVNWFIEPIPTDLKQKIAIFKDKAINRTFQNVEFDEYKFVYNHDIK